MNLRIDINKNLEVDIKTLHEPFKMCYLFEHLEYAHELNFVEYILDLTRKNAGILHYKLDNKIARHLRIEDNKLILSKFWAQDYCKSGGCNKQDFIGIQLLLYELKEFYDLGLWDFEIYYGNKQIFPIWGQVIFRAGRTTREMIKAIKKKAKPSGKCEFKGLDKKDHHIFICCVCGNKDRELCEL